MAWTWPTGVFFLVLVISVTAMGIWEVFSPGGNPRRGIFRIDTTRGDRLFISWLGNGVHSLAVAGTRGHTLVGSSGHFDSLVPVRVQVGLIGCRSEDSTIGMVLREQNLDALSRNPLDVLIGRWRYQRRRVRRVTGGAGRESPSDRCQGLRRIYQPAFIQPDLGWNQVHGKL